MTGSNSQSDPSDLSNYGTDKTKQAGTMANKQYVQETQLNSFVDCIICHASLCPRIVCIKQVLQYL